MGVFTPIQLTPQLTSADSDAILKRSLHRSCFKTEYAGEMPTPQAGSEAASKPYPAKELPNAVGFLLLVPLVRLNCRRSACGNGGVFRAAR